MSTPYEEFEAQTLAQQAMQSALHADAATLYPKARKSEKDVFVEDEDDDMFDNMPV